MRKKRVIVKSYKRKGLRTRSAVKKHDRYIRAAHNPKELYINHINDVFRVNSIPLSLMDISRISGVNPETTRKYIEYLRTKGWVKKIDRNGKNLWMRT